MIRNLPKCIRTPRAAMQELQNWGDARYFALVQNEHLRMAKDGVAVVNGQREFVRSAWNSFEEDDADRARQWLNAHVDGEHSKAVKP